MGEKRPQEKAEKRAEEESRHPRSEQHVHAEESGTPAPSDRSFSGRVRGLLTKGLGPYTVAVWLLILVLAAVFIYSAVSLLGRADQDRRNREIQERNQSLGGREETAAPRTELPDLTPVPEITEAATQVPPEESPAATEEAAGPGGAAVVQHTPAPTATLAPMATQAVARERFASLVQMNPDTAGWLKVDCLYRINFVVVQGKNSYYMDHDFDGQVNVNGTAFLDEQCALNRHPQNFMIFGHNMKTGDMFGELHQISDPGKLKANFLAHFDTLYEDADYVPVAAGKVSLVPDTESYFPFFVSRFENEEEFNHYIERARAISEIELPVDVRYGDQLMTLVTCTGDDNERYIALFRRVRSGEDVSGYPDLL